MADKTSTARTNQLEQAPPPSQDMTTQRAKNQAAIRLLNEWLADESGYDEAAWPVAKQAIETYRLSARPRFHD